MESKVQSESTCYPSTGGGSSEGSCSAPQSSEGYQIVEASYVSTRKIMRVSRPDRNYCGTGGGCTSCFWLITFVSNLVFAVLFGNLCAKYDRFRRLDADEADPMPSTTKTIFEHVLAVEPVADGGEVVDPMSREVLNATRRLSSRRRYSYAYSYSYDTRRRYSYYTPYISYTSYSYYYGASVAAARSECYSKFTGFKITAIITGIVHFLLACCWCFTWGSGYTHETLRRHLSNIKENHKPWISVQLRDKGSWDKQTLQYPIVRSADFTPSLAEIVRFVKETNPDLVAGTYLLRLRHEVQVYFDSWQTREDFQTWCRSRRPTHITVECLKAEVGCHPALPIIHDDCFVELDPATSDSTERLIVVNRFMLFWVFFLGLPCVYVPCALESKVIDVTYPVLKVISSSWGAAISEDEVIDVLEINADFLQNLKGELPQMQASVIGNTVSV